MLKKLNGRLRPTFFRIMEDERLKFEEERLKDQYKTYLENAKKELNTQNK